MTAAVQPKEARFSPEMYDVGTMDEAKFVILSPFDGETVEERWQRETPFLGQQIVDNLGLTKDSLLLDYGCGVGRLSHEVIKRTGCRVVGVDYSANMRAFAANYTDTPRFMACDAEMLDVIGPYQFDAAIAVWVLQHCLSPIVEIRQIIKSLKPGGLLFVLNDLRFVPTDRGFMSDHIDVKSLLDENMKLKKVIGVDPLIGKVLASRCYCALYEKI